MIMIQRDPLDLASLEGQTFIIGREGHIYLHDTTVSRQHASLRISGGRIYVEDLDSRNGTYLVHRGVLRMPDSRPVSPLQQLLIGDHQYRVADLLSIACKFYGSNAQTTLVRGKRVDVAI